MADLKLNLEETAATCYRAWHYAAAWKQQPWDHLSLDEQSLWLRMAKSCERIMELSEGKSYADAGESLAKVHCGDRDVVYTVYTANSRLKLAWQALARHLVTLMDSDDVESLDSLEQSWGPWAEERGLRGVLEG